MSKLKQTQTKKNNRQTPLDNKLGSKKDNPLFPYTLRGKKFKRPENFLGLSKERLGSFDEWKTLLEQYLETENPDYLFEAIRENNGILQGKGRNLVVEEHLREKGEVQSEPDSIYMDSHTIVWETIYWWQKLHVLGSSNKEKEIIVELLRKQGAIDKANRLAQEK